MFNASGRIEFKEVEGLRTGRFDTGVNTAAWVYRIGTCVVDTGPANRWAQVKKFLAERPVEKVILSHHHEDHSGNARNIQKAWGARVYAPEASLKRLKQGFKIHLYRKLVWGVPGLVEAIPLPSAVDLEPERMSLQAVPAPGHSRDMHCLLEADRGWLFTADLFVARKIRYLRADEDANQEIDSLEKILDLPFNTIFCAHAGVVENGRQALKDKLEHMLGLRAEVRRLRQKGLPVGQITKQVLGPEDHLTWFSGGHFSKANLVKSLLRSAG